MIEQWVPITGFEGMYEISNHGRVRSLDRKVGHRWGGNAIKKGKILKPKIDTNGYYFYSLANRGKLKYAKCHRLVAMHFIPGNHSCEVNHKDLNKTNNHVENLEWVTHSENIAHAVKAKVFSALHNPKQAKKLTPELVAEIRKLKSSTKITAKELGKQFGIYPGTVQKIVSNLIWK